MPFRNYRFPSPRFLYQSLPSFFPHKIPLSTMHFGDDFLAHTHVVASKTNYRKLQSIWEQKDSLWHYKGSSGTQLSGMQSTLPRVFKDFQLGGLSPTSFPQTETRCAEPGVPPRASHVITGTPRRRVSILTFLDHEGARDTLEHVSLDSTALASATLSSPGSLLLPCLFYHYCP